jgi:3-deoxy-D-manno-octulosonic-acid transferase
MIQFLGYILYHVGLGLYGLLVRLVSPWNSKAKLFVAGRKNLLTQISDRLANEPRERIWFHCASLGEFEQARPLMEKLKKEYPRFAIVVTFFSPSGYEIRKNYTGADYIFYLPSDSAKNARQFVASVNPHLAFFVKYEIWYHYLRVLKQRNIPVLLISANFRNDHVYFKWYGTFFKQMLHGFRYIFSQNEASAALLTRNGFSANSVSKDTRFDRVFENSKNPKELPLIALFKQGKQLLVAGSSYTAEETIIAAGMKDLKDWKIVIAPHHIEQTRIDEIIKRFEFYGVTTFSALSKDESLAEKRVLVIDNIGMLSAIYQYGSAAFIGGGFGKSGLHNTLEAAVFGMPILFGPNNLKKFPESLDMIADGVGYIIQNEQEFEGRMKDWDANPLQLKAVADNARHFIVSQTGATEHIFQYLGEQRLL